MAQGYLATYMCFALHYSNSYVGRDMFGTGVFGNPYVLWFTLLQQLCRRDMFGTGVPGNPYVLCFTLLQQLCKNVYPHYSSFSIRNVVAIFHIMCGVGHKSLLYRYQHDPHNYANLTIFDHYLALGSVTAGPSCADI